MRLAVAEAGARRARALGSRLRAGAVAARDALIRHRVSLTLAAILLLGLVVRWERAGWGLPYLQHWDEPFIVNRALHMVQTADFNPHFFNYGSLVLYLDAAVDVAHFYTLAGLPDGDPHRLRSPQEVRFKGSVEDSLTNAPEEPNYFVSHPSFYLWNRRLTGAFGALAILLVYALARELAGSARAAVAGLVAALALATNPFHLEQSALATTDLPAATLVLATLWLTLRFARGQAPRDLCLAFAVGGLAVSTKYNMAPVLLVPAGVLALAAWRGWAGYRRWQWGALLAIPAAAFLLATPFALLDLPTFLVDTAKMLHVYVGEPAGQMPGEVAPGWAHLRLDLQLLWIFLGPSVAIGALGGLVLAMRRGAGLVVFALGLLVLAGTASTRAAYHRNLGLLYPLAAIAFGVLVAALLTDGPWRRARRIVAAAFLLGLVWTAQGAVRASWHAGADPESRSRIVDRLDGLAGWRRVGIARELRLHPLDLARLRGEVVQRPLARLLCTPSGEDLLVLPIAFSAFSPRGEVVKTRYDRLLALAGPRLVEVEPTHSLTIDSPPANPGIAVYRPVAPPSVLPGECLESLAPAGMELSGAARRLGASARLRPGGGLVTPPLAVPAGSSVISMQLAASAEATLAIRLRVVGAKDGAVVAERRWTVDRLRQPLALPLWLPTSRQVRIRVDAEEAGGGEVLVDSLALQSGGDVDTIGTRRGTSGKGARWRPRRPH